MSLQEEHINEPIPGHLLAAEVAAKTAASNAGLMAKPVTITFSHLYSLMFGFCSEDQRTIDYVVVSPGLATFIQKLDPAAAAVTVVDVEVWRTAAYRTSYKAYQARKALQAQRLAVVGEQSDTFNRIFKALRVAGFSITHAERMAKFASENDDTRKIVEALCP